MAVKQRTVQVADRDTGLENLLNDPFGRPSVAIPSNPAGQWDFREVNSAIPGNHLWTLLNHRKWTYAGEADIVGHADEYGWEVRDGRLVKGTRGEIVLLKRSVDVSNAVALAKDAANRRETFAKTKIKESIVSGVTSKHGDEAGEFIHNNLSGIQVTDGRERMSADEE
jgi:hypothetical protein